MSKLSFSLASLIAVIPAAFMIYVLVMGFIAGMPMMLMVASGLAIICGVGVVLLPVLSFIVGPKAAKSAAAEGAASTRKKTEEDVDEEEFEDLAEEDEFGEEMETSDDQEFGGDDEWDNFDDEFEDE